MSGTQTYGLLASYVLEEAFPVGGYTLGKSWLKRGNWKVTKLERKLETHPLKPSTKKGKGTLFPPPKEQPNQRMNLD